MDKKGIEDIVALTPLQEGLLFHYLKNPRDDLYFEQLSLVISGKIDIAIFERAWNVVVETNEMLRTVFRWENVERPVQLVLKEYKLQPAYYDFSGKNVNGKRECLEEIKVKDRRETFDLGKGEVPLRVILCKVEKAKYEMIISNHHILYDGWSSGIILQEFINVYCDLTEGNELINRPVKSKYRDFVKWIQNRDTKKQEEYWTDYLQEFDTGAGLSSLAKGKRSNGEQGVNNYRIRFSKEKTGELGSFVKEYRITLAALLYSAWGILLQSYANSGDVIFGTTVSGRTAKVQGIEDIVGLFINTVPLRVQSLPREKAGDLLSRIDKTLQVREAHTSTSLVDIKEYMNLDSRENFFDTLVVLENYPLAGRLLAGNGKISVDSYEAFERTHYDLTVGITVFEGIELNFIYDRELFSEQSIVRLAGHFRRITEGIIENPLGEVAGIGILSGEEKRRLLVDFNRSETVYPGDKTIHELFEGQVERMPESTALSDSDVAVTYKELNKKSGRLAHLLREKGVKRGTIAALMVERSVEMIIGIIAVLKAGGAYLPINPKNPGLRIKYMLADSNAGILLTTRKISKELSFVKEVVYFSDAINRFFVPTPAPAADSSLAYIIYTSGSTGKPKGVPITHANLSPLLHWGYRHLGIGGADRTLQNLSYYFDWSVWEIFITLTSGACLYMVSEDVLLNPERCIDFINKNEISVLHITPTRYGYLANSGRKTGTLRYLFMGGEKLTVDLVERSFELIGDHCRIFNMYGPTEATIISAVLEIHRWKYSEFKGMSSVPIGKPAANLRLFILDKNRNVCPLNITGELYISGDGVAAGYLNNPELTNERFSSVASVTSVAKKMYETGDLARWLPDGNIEFLGRTDHQVKIRGFRIELGEIENRLLEHRAVKEAVVVTGEQGPGDKYCCAYVVGDFAETASMASELKDYLALTLPGYMVPSYFVFLDRLPLTPNGKIDRKALPEPVKKAGAGYIAPRNERERLLVEMWCDVLQIEGDGAGIDDDFFELGGHSLKATALLARIRKIFDVNIPLIELFTSPTVRGLSLYMEKAGRVIYRSIEPVEEKEYYELSSAQERVYVLQQMAKGSTAYHMTEIFELEGFLDKAGFEGVFLKLIERHESLRTSFRMLGDKPVQVIRDAVTFAIEYYEDENEKIIKNFVKPFDLSCAPLLRVGLMKKDEADYILMVDMHHIISDGVSVEVFIREFTGFYKGSELPVLKLRYRDYAQWQRENKEGNQREYWLKKFEGEVPVLQLPTDYVRPVVQGFEGRTVVFVIGSEEAGLLKKIGLEEGATLYMVLLALTFIFLSKLSRGEDIVVGTPAAGRGHADLEQVMGMFVNILALRNFPQGGKPFREFLMEVKETAVTAFENQDYQYEDLVDDVVVKRDAGRNPLFDAVFTLHDENFLHLDLPDLKIKNCEFESGISKFDLTLFGMESEGGLSFRLEYSTKLFKEETIERFIIFFKRILSCIVKNPDVTLSGIELISGEEKHGILYKFNDTGSEYPEDQSIHQIFAAQVEKTPDNIAVVDVGHPIPFLVTYRELNRRAEGLAVLLRYKGVDTGCIVGLMTEPCLEMVVGLLAVLKAGGAYLPVNPGYPRERKNYLLKDGNVKLLLTGCSPEQSGEMCADIIVIDLTRKIQTTLSSHLTPHSQGNLAYIIYTSGSTGNPKGVMVDHRSVVRLVKNTNYVQFREGNRILQTGALEFDASTFEIWGTLLNGAVLYLAPKDTVLTPLKLKKTIREHRIDIMWMTSPLFNRMVDADIEIFQGPGLLLVGGDVLSPPHIMRIRARFPQLKIINGYGPTENTTFSTTFFIDKEYEGRIPIGKPIANSTAYIVDKSDHLVPIGLEGELLVGGHGVARGYLNNPELTAEKFYLWRPGKNKSYKSYLSYRTGDLARWLPDGNIEFLGRTDHQVKIRGFRIELGEIEKRLLEHGAVREAVVVTGSEGPGDNYCCAYVVGTFEKSASIATELKEHLSTTLPDYMIPSYFVLLEKLPLTSNGKIDRKALPEPDKKHGVEYMAPRNERERLLVEMWSEVLQIEGNGPGIDDNFFELGGHSLKAAGLIARIRETFDMDIPLVELFISPTVRGLSLYMEKAGKSIYRPIEPVEDREYYELSSAQKRLYVLQQMGENSTGYHMTEVFELEGFLDKAGFEEVFLQLIKRHECLRTSFRMLGEEPVQEIRNAVTFAIEYYEDEKKNIIKNFVKPFDLSRAPLLRVGLMKIDETHYILMVDMHHIISDGASVDVFIREFIGLYRGRELPGLKLRYRDYSQWQQENKESDGLIRQREYWLRRFEGEIPVLQLPADYVRPVVQGFEGRAVAFVIGSEQAGALKKIGLEEGATLFMVLAAVTFIFLSKLSGGEDIVVGTPAAGRRHADWEQVVGMFVNTLALRNFPRGGKSFREFLKEVKETAIMAFENQDYQYEDLVEAVAAARDTSRNPLFDTAFALQTANSGHLEIPGVKIKNREFESGISKFDLTLFGMEQEHGLWFRLEYCTKLFKEERIEGFINYFKGIVSSVVENPGKKIEQMEIISDWEKHRVLFDLNRKETEYPDNKTLHRLFEEQVEKTPDSMALSDSSAAVTYNELNDKSNRLAYILIQKGVKPGTIAGIMVERSIEMIVGILGILKAGGAYLPINPKNPGLRIKYMLADSNAGILLTTRKISKELSFVKEVVYFSDAINRVPIPTSATCNRQLAYVIYTSGSTGKPKGVPITHANVSPLLHWGYRHLGIGAADRALQNLSYYFDWSVWEIFITLTSGARLYMASEDVLLNPERCIDFICGNEITVLHITPTQYGYLANSGRKTGTLRYLFIGGEKLTVDLVERSFELVSDHCRVFNMYGPTEVTIISAVLDIHRWKYSEFKGLSSVPIGRPTANLRLFVLDKDKNVCPVNITGELYISGDGLAAGYLNNPELTVEKFCLWRPGENKSYMSYLSYRTGDLARWLPDGNVEFLGRRDHQVKVRGLRIELGEIENRLLTHEKVGEAVVIDRGKSLCAYIVPAGGTGASDRMPGSVELKEYLSKTLPNYMIPSYFVPIERIPLSANGKVDRSVLPDPEMKPGEARTAPRNEIEKKLADIWWGILGRLYSGSKGNRPFIGIDDDFFELGGHSLDAALLASRIQKAFNVKLPLVEIFQTPFIRALASYIKETERDGYNAVKPLEKREYEDASYAQKRLWVLSQSEASSLSFNIPGVYPWEQTMDIDILKRVFHCLIERHESLRTVFFMKEGEVKQRILAARGQGFSLEYKDLSAVIDEEEKERKVHSQMEREHNTAFDLSTGPLLRACLVRIEEKKYLLLFTMHHIISDFLSIEVLRREVLTLYHSFAKGETSPLKPLKVQYRDYTLWQNEQLTGGYLEQLRDYWQSRFKGKLPVLDLPYDKVRPRILSYRGENLGYDIPEGLIGKLKILGEENNATLFMVLLSSVYVLLFHYTGQRDIILGVTAAGREDAELENQIGFYLNVLPLRAIFDEKSTFTALLKIVREITLKAYEHQLYPFDQLVDGLGIRREMNRHPLFDVAVNMNNLTRSDGAVVHTVIKSIKEDGLIFYPGRSKYDLAVVFTESVKTVEVMFAYGTDLFKRETVKRMVHRYRRLLEGIIKNARIPISNFRLQEDEEILVPGFRTFARRAG